GGRRVGSRIADIAADAVAGDRGTGVVRHCGAAVLGPGGRAVAGTDAADSEAHAHAVAAAVGVGRAGRDRRAPAAGPKDVAGTEAGAGVVHLAAGRDA